MSKRHDPDRWYRCGTCGRGFAIDYTDHLTGEKLWDHNHNGTQLDLFAGAVS